MSLILNFLLYAIPWWFWLLLLVMVLGIVYAWLQGLVGWRKAAEIVGGTALAGGVAVLVQRSRQEGYADRTIQLAKDNAKAAQQYKDTSDATARLPDAALDRDNAKWVRPASPAFRKL